MIWSICLCSSKSDPYSHCDSMHCIVDDLLPREILGNSRDFQRVIYDLGQRHPLHSNPSIILKQVNSCVLLHDWPKMLKIPLDIHGRLYIIPRVNPNSAMKYIQLPQIILPQGINAMKYVQFHTPPL